MQIPVNSLDPDTLHNVVEAFVLREGTDYGAEEIALQDKVDAVIAQLKRGEAVILYSELHESVDIVSAQAFKQAQTQG